MQRIASYEDADGIDAAPVYLKWVILVLCLAIFLPH